MCSIRSTYKALFAFLTLALQGKGAGFPLPDLYTDSSSLMINGGSPYMDPNAVPSGYDPSLNYGMTTTTGVNIGGGFPPMPGGMSPLLVPGPYGGNTASPWGQMPPYGQAPYGGSPYGGSPYGLTPYGGSPYGGSPYGNTPYSPNMGIGNLFPGNSFPGGPNVININVAGLAANSPIGASTIPGMNIPGISGSSGLSGIGNIAGILPSGNPLSPAGMSPFNNPFSLASIMASMQMSGTGMPGMGLPGMGLPNMNLHTAMMMFSPEYQKAFSQSQINTSAATLRTLLSMNNATLAKKIKADLEGYQKNLEALAATPTESMPSGINASDIQNQLSRVNLALTDPSTLLGEPNSTTAPEKGLRAERSERLNALLAKWSASDGGGAFPSATLSPKPSLLSAIKIPVLISVREALNGIEEDERLLSVMKEELNLDTDGETIRRINNALFNTLIAKARQYDRLMDSLSKQDWEQLIDQERGVSVSSFSLPIRPSTNTLRPGLSSLRRSPARPVTPRTMLPQKSSTDFGRDEAIQLQEEMRALVAAFEMRSDTTLGGDAGMKGRLIVQLKKLDEVVAVMDDPTRPNPFRSASPKMQEILQLWTQLSSTDFTTLTLQDLSGYAEILKGVLSSPVGQLHPQIKYSDVQSLVNRLVGMIASQIYTQASNDSSKGQYGSRVKRFVGSFSIKATQMYNEAEQIAALLKQGDYLRYDAGVLASSVTREGAIALVKELNERYMKEQKRWWAQSNLDTRLGKARRIAEKLLNTFNSLDSDTLSTTALQTKFSLQDLKQKWSDMVDFYYNADYATWSSAEEQKNEESLAESAKKTATAVGGRTVIKAASQAVQKVKSATTRGSKEPVSNEDEGDLQLEPNTGRAVNEATPSDPTTEKINTFLKSESGIESLIQALETAIANEFMRLPPLIAATVKSDVKGTVGTLQEAYIYRYSGFMNREVLGEFSQWTDERLKLVDEALAEIARQSIAIAD